MERSTKKRLLIIIGVCLIGGGFELLKSMGESQANHARKTQIALARMEVNTYSRSKAGKEAQSTSNEWERKKAERLAKVQVTKSRANGITLDQLKQQAQAQAEQEHSFEHGEEDPSGEDGSKTAKSDKKDKKKKGKKDKKKKGKSDKGDDAEEGGEEDSENNEEDEDKDGEEKKEGDEDDESENADKDRDESTSDKKADNQENNNQEESDGRSDTETVSTNTQVPIAPGGVGVGQPKADQDSLTYEEWARALLNQPNFKKVTELIRLQQSNQISNAIFYKLVQAMLDDSRMTMREMGVLAAGRTPSYESFLVLSRVIQSESYNSPLSAKAKKELRLYSQLTYLSTLKTVMQQSEEAFAVMLAAEKLDESARHYLAISGDSGSSDSGMPDSAQDQNTPPTQKHASVFESFISILEYRSTSSSDSELGQTLSRTLETLQQLLKG